MTLINPFRRNKARNEQQRITDARRRRMLRQAVMLSRESTPLPDLSKPIPPVDDQYLDWPGKADGKPKPEIVWLERGE